MNIKNKNTCPIGIKTDKNVNKSVAFLTLFFLIISYFENNFLLILVYEFSVRLFYPKISFFIFISKIFLYKIFNINKKFEYINLPAKKTAQLIGLIFSFFLFILSDHTGNYKNIFYTLFLLAVFMEVFFDYCIACKIYNWIEKIKKKKEKH